MENSYIYNFDDFTHKHYKELLRLALSKYRFQFYTDALFDAKTILWRHDVDHSLNEALNLAKIECQLMVKSTYFISLHSEFYSPFEKKSSEILFEILNLGHCLGLHFDTHYYGVTSENELEDKLQFERGIFEKLFNTKVGVFSFHNTTEFTMNCKRWEYGGMINTYASYFQDGTNYCSDSNGYWRHKRLWDFLSDSHRKPLQILTHPEWWTENTMSPKQKIDQGILMRAEESKMLYESKLALFGRENIDW